MSDAPILKALKAVLPELWKNDATASPRVRDRRESARPSYGQSDVTALLAQELVGGHLMFCGSIDGERRYANDAHWDAFDLMPDDFNADSIVADGTLIDSARLLRDDPDLAARFAEFRRLAFRHALTLLADRP